jgi:hypothetical protein
MRPATFFALAMLALGCPDDLNELFAVPARNAPNDVADCNA